MIKIIRQIRFKLNCWLMIRLVLPATLPQADIKSAVFQSVREGFCFVSCHPANHEPFLIIWNAIPFLLKKSQWLTFTYFAAWIIFFLAKRKSSYFETTLFRDVKCCLEKALLDGLISKLCSMPMYYCSVLLNWEGYQREDGCNISYSRLNERLLFE